MKQCFVILLVLLLAGASNAQQKKDYQIKIKTLKNLVVKGVFHQLGDNSFVVVSHKTDTIFVNFGQVKKLRVYEKGILGPSLLTGAGTVGLLSLVTGPMAGAFLVAGIPVGLTVGYIVANVVSTKKRYQNFQSLDLSLIKQELEPYDQIIR